MNLHSIKNSSNLAIKRLFLIALPHTRPHGYHVLRITVRVPFCAFEFVALPHCSNTFVYYVRITWRRATVSVWRAIVRWVVVRPYIVAPVELRSRTSSRCGGAP